LEVRERARVERRLDPKELTRRAVERGVVICMCAFRTRESKYRERNVGLGEDSYENGLGVNEKIELEKMRP